MPPKANRPKRNGHRGGAHEPYAGEDKPGVKSATDLQMAMTKNQVPAADNTTTSMEKHFNPGKAPENPAEKSPEAPKAKVPAMVQEKIFVRYEFIDAEKLAIGSKFAQSNSRIAQLKAELKAINADYKSKIEGLTSEVSAGTEQINSGFEMREMECNVLHNRDGKPPYKAYYRTDNGAFVKKESMNMSDHSMLSQPWPKGKKIEDSWLPEMPKEEKK